LVGWSISGILSKKRWYFVQFDSGCWRHGHHVSSGDSCEFHSAGVGLFHLLLLTDEFCTHRYLNICRYSRWIDAWGGWDIFPLIVKFELELPRVAVGSSNLPYCDRQVVYGLVLSLLDKFVKACDVFEWSDDFCAAWS
jgi:hypothetical protein